MTRQEKYLVSHLVNELEQNHVNFRSRLAAQYPVLTAYDLRLCVMIKSQLATKEIASLLNIIPDSVKKAKHRLRKKLEIPAGYSWHTALAKLETDLLENKWD